MRHMRHAYTILYGTQTNGVLKYEVDTTGPELGSSGSECENEL
jgi:hypothetical protein